MVTNDNWSEFNTRLRAYIGRRVDANLVDDVFGEIVLRVAEHQDSFDKADNSLAWLYRVASNVITDHYRRRGVEQHALRYIRDDASATNLHETDDNYAEMAECLQAMIESLPDDYRQALELTDLNGVTQNRAAEQLGISVSGMKSRVQRGREKLKQILNRCCQFEVNARGEVVDMTQRDTKNYCDKR